jgi:nitroreductase
MDLLEGIYTRRSVRDYTDQPVAREQVLEVIKAGSWAPSGLNNQPWRFVIVRDKAKRGELAKLTRYGRIIEAAPVSIAVFIDRTAMYHDTKDHQAIGACLQNMLLAVHALGLGGVWLGEILKSGAEVRNLLGLSDHLELMAVIALGHPQNRERRSNRKDISELLLKEF